MNDRKLCGISVCITYVVLSILCLFLALSGLIPFAGLQRFLIDLPIILQIRVADAIGLGPVLNLLSCMVHWSAPYVALLIPTLYGLYWIGWWIKRFDEDR